MKETGSAAVLCDNEVVRFEAVTIAVLALSITHDAEKLPMRASWHRVGETGTLPMNDSWFNPIKLTKFWPQHRAV